MASSTTPPAFLDADVLRWLGAYTSSVTGDLVYFVTLTWAVAHGRGPAEVGVVLAVGAVPRAALMLGGGVIADRVEPRRVLLGSDLVRCVVVLSVAALTYLTGGTALWMLFVLALLFGGVDALFMPAVGALPPRIGEASQLGRIQAMRSLAVRSSNAVGPLIAASTLAVGGAAAAFAVAGLLFTGSLALLIAVRVRPAIPAVERDGRQVGPWQDLRDGLRHLRGNRRLTGLVVVIGLAEMCFSGPVAAGLVLLVEERGWGPGALGWILAGFSVGGAASGVALTAVHRVPRAGAVMAGSLLLTAVLVTATGLAHDMRLAVAFGTLLGAVSGAAMVLANALLQGEAEPRYLGRVTSVTTLCTVGLGPLLYPLVGLVTAGWGVSVFFAGCGAICVFAAATSLSPALRDSRLA